MKAYSFGGRLGDLHLVDYVWNKWREGPVVDGVDHKLDGEFNNNEVLLVFKLGLMCSSNGQSARLAMR